MTLAIIAGSLLAALALVAGTLLTLMRRGVGKVHWMLAPGINEGDPERLIKVRVKEDHPLAKLLSVLSLGRPRAVCDGETIYLGDGDLGPSNHHGSSGVLHELIHVLQCLIECGGSVKQFLVRISGQWAIGFYWNGRWERQARESAKRLRTTYVIQYTDGHFWRKSEVNGSWSRFCRCTGS